MNQTLTLTLTEEETINLKNTVRYQLDDARRKVREGWGSSALVDRLEILQDRLQAMLVEFSS